MAIELSLDIEHEDQREYLFDREEVTVGCHPFADITLPETGIAARHGRFQLDAEGLHFELLSDRSEVVRLRQGVREGVSSRCRLEVGDELLFGANELVRFRVMGFAQLPSTERIESLALDPGASAFEQWCMLDEHIQRLAIDTQSLLLGATDLMSIRDILQRLFNQLFPGASVALVVPEGEQFRDRVLICGGERCAATMLHPDSAELLESLTRGIRVMEMPKGWDVHLPFVQAGKLQAYLRLQVLHQPDASHLERLAALGAWIRPGLLSILRAEQQSNEIKQLQAENKHFRARARRHYLFKELVSESPAMRRLYEQLNLHLATDDSVLVLGDAGSGKELVARALHHLGPRRDAMFIAQHCGELNAEDLDIELFGLQQGCGEAAYRGILELADGGTVFLDEIERLPLVTQTKLCRVLREREVRRIGDEVGRTVNVRVIASSHYDLASLVRMGSFRRDLLGAFEGATLVVPSLRERNEDILPMSEHFVHKYNRRYGLNVEGIGPSASQRLLTHIWQGNVRELQLVIETAVIKARQGLIEEHHLNLVDTVESSPGSEH